MNRFTDLGSSVSSIEIDINTQLAKAWTDIDRLYVIWKSDLSDFASSGHVRTALWMQHMDADRAF